MKPTFSIILFAALVGGCGSHGPRAAYTAGEIGCPPSEIAISEGDVGWATNTWTATCRGRVFYCTYSASQNMNSRTICREGLSAKAHSDTPTSQQRSTAFPANTSIQGTQVNANGKPCESSGQIAAMAYRARNEGRPSLEWMLEDSDRQTAKLAYPYPEIAREVVKIGFDARTVTEARIEARDYCLNRLQMSR